MDSSACMICGHGGHTVTRCPELVAPLRDGFYRGGGNGGGHSHDEDDEKVINENTPLTCLRLLWCSSLT